MTWSHVSRTPSSIVLFFKMERHVANLGEDTREEVKGAGDSESKGDITYWFVSYCVCK